MDIKYVRELCKSFGIVKNFRKNDAFFGNIELEIETPRKTRLSIISDRGLFSCYVMRKGLLLSKRKPFDKEANGENKNEFSSLEEAIDYLKRNLDIIEKNW